MDISINEQNQEWFKQLFESGKYPAVAVDEAMEKARQLLEEREQTLADELAEIRE